DRTVLDLFPDDAGLRRWIEMAETKVPFQGLPARICWLGYGERAKAGLAFNELVRSGAVKAPIVIGRDHLDAGSVASPNRETEGMRDGSDAIADWPLLNALVEGVPHEEARHQVRSADVIVDNLLTGDYELVSMEAMASNRVAVANIQDTARAASPDAPVYTVDP